MRQITNGDIADFALHIKGPRSMFSLILIQKNTSYQKLFSVRKILFKVIAMYGRQTLKEAVRGENFDVYEGYLRGILG